MAVFPGRRRQDRRGPPRNILLQIILEEEAGGADVLSDLLSQMIRFYGNAMQGMMGKYLESNIKAFTDMQAKLPRIRSAPVWENATVSQDLWASSSTSRACHAEHDGRLHGAESRRCTRRCRSSSTARRATSSPASSFRFPAGLQSREGDGGPPPAEPSDAAGDVRAAHRRGPLPTGFSRTHDQSKTPRRPESRLRFPGCPKALVDSEHILTRCGPRATDLAVL